MKRDEAKRLHAIQAREDIWARREHFFTRWSEAHAYDTCAKCGVVAPSKGHCTGVLRPGGPLRPRVTIRAWGPRRWSRGLLGTDRVIRCSGHDLSQFCDDRCPERPAVVPARRRLPAARTVRAATPQRNRRAPM